MANGFDWSKYEEVKDDDSSFDWSQYETQEATPLEPESRTLEATGAGFAKEATFDLADELAGAIGAGTEKVLSKIPGTEAYKAKQIDKELTEQGFTGDVGEKDLTELYRQYRDIYRQREEQLEEQHPYAFTSGQVGGMVVPGVGALKGAAKTTKGLSTAAKMGIMGGLTGAGLSEADLTTGEIEPFIKDVGVSGLLGLGTGKIVQKGGEFAQKALTEENFPKLARLAKQFKEGTKGVKTFSEQFRKESQVSEAAKKNITEPLLKIVDEARAAKDQILKESKKLLPKAEIADTLRYNIKQIAGGNKEIENKLTNYVQKQFQNQFENVSQITPKELDLFSRIIKENAPVDETYTKAAQTLSAKINNEVLGSIEPKLIELNKAINKPLTVLEDVLKIPKESKYDDIVQQADKFVEELGKGTPTATQSAKIEQVKSSFGKIFGEEKASEMVSNLQEAASKRGLFTKSKKASESLSPISDYTANLAGLAVKKPVQIGKTLYNIDKNAAQKLLKNIEPMTGPTAEKTKMLLNEFINTSDQIKKNATLFTLSQNPLTRELLKGILETEE